MTGDSRQHLQEMSAKLQMTLTNFGVNARVTNVICGPTSAPSMRFSRRNGGKSK